MDTSVLAVTNVNVCHFIAIRQEHPSVYVYICSYDRATAGFCVFLLESPSLCPSIPIFNTDWFDTLLVAFIAHHHCFLEHAQSAEANCSPLICKKQTGMIS